MKRAVAVIGVVLVVLGALLLLQGAHILPEIVKLRGQWANPLGWGAWGLAFGAGALVWANRERPKG